MVPKIMKLELEAKRKLFCPLPARESGDRITRNPKSRVNAASPR
jgi:hypothetical protein